MGFGKKTTNDALLAAASGMVHSDSMRSFQDIFSTENSVQAKDLIMHGIRHELYHGQGRAISESGSEEYVINKIDPVDQTVKPTLIRIDKKTRKSTMLLAGPKFRFHTVEPEIQLKRDTIYPISVKFFAFLLTNFLLFSILISVLLVF